MLQYDVIFVHVLQSLLQNIVPHLGTNCLTGGEIKSTQVPFWARKGYS